MTVRDGGLQVNYNHSFDHINLGRYGLFLSLLATDSHQGVSWFLPLFCPPGIVTLVVDPSFFLLLLVTLSPRPLYVRYRPLLMACVTLALVAAEPELYRQYVKGLTANMRTAAEAESKAQGSWWTPVMVTMIPCYHGVPLSSESLPVDLLRLALLHGYFGAYRLPGYIASHGGSVLSLRMAAILTLQAIVGFVVPIALLLSRNKTRAEVSGAKESKLELVHEYEPAPQGARGSLAAVKAPKSVYLQQWAEEFHGLEPDDITPEVRVGKGGG